jgi:hypothetical protein
MKLYGVDRWGKERKAWRKMAKESKRSSER